MSGATSHGGTQQAGADAGQELGGVGGTSAGRSNAGGTSAGGSTAAKGGTVGVSGGSGGARPFGGSSGAAASPGGAKQCEALNAPENGVVALSGRDVDAQATYSCKSGFYLQGNGSRRCQATGAWSGTAPTCAACAFQVEEDTLALWSMSQDTGQQVTDFGPKGLNGTLGATVAVGLDDPEWHNFGRFDQGLEFSPSPSTEHVYVPVGPAFSTGHFTFESHVRLRSGTSTLYRAGAYTMIISAVLPTELRLYLGDGVPPDEGGSDWVVRTFDAALTEWTWYYLAVTYDGQSATVYVDGKPIGTQAFGVTLSKTRTESWIGGVPSYSGPARGIIGPMRISSTVHSAEAIQSAHEVALRCEPK